MNRRSFIKNVGGAGVAVAIGDGALESQASAAGNPNNYIASGIGIYGAGYHCTGNNVYAQDRYNLSVRNIQRHLGVSADGVMGVRTDRAV